jgi:hypothetical protein
MDPAVAATGMMLLGQRHAPFCDGYGIVWADVNGGLRGTAPHRSHNDALKWFRECLYATGHKFIDFPLDFAIAVRQVVHEAKGKGFRFSDEGAIWDWRQMLISLEDDKIDIVFRHRVIRIGVEVREGQPDHSYLVAAREINGARAVSGMERLHLDRLPCHVVDRAAEVVDFFFERVMDRRS